MKPTMKAVFLGGVLAIATLFALPSVSEAHGGRWGRPYYGYYHPRAYSTYHYGWHYPGYYYRPGVTVYRYRPHYYYDYYYGYGPRAAFRAGPVGVWW